MLRLAVPVVLGELGWMAMGVVDAAMVGRVSAEALGALSLRRAVYFAVVIFGIGLLMGLDTLVKRLDAAEYLVVVRGAATAVQVEGKSFTGGTFEGDVVVYALAGGDPIGSFSVNASADDKVTTRVTSGKRSAAGQLTRNLNVNVLHAIDTALVRMGASPG